MVGEDSATSKTYTDKDAGKAVKLATGLPDSRVVFCADGDEIAGQLRTIEPEQTSAGFKLGTVRFASSPMLTGKVASGTIALLDEVVAAAQNGAGVPNDTPPYHDVMLVKKAGTANGLRLKVVAFQSGSGAVGSVVTLSKMAN